MFLKAFFSLAFYIVKHLHPFDLRVLYLTPRSALGARQPQDEPFGDQEGADDIEASLGLAVACVGSLAAVTFLLRRALGLLGTSRKLNPTEAPVGTPREPPEAVPPTKSGSKQGHGGGPATATTWREFCSDKAAAWALGVSACWAALLLPTLGLAGAHGWTLVAADRYAYLPSALVLAPATAKLYDSVNDRCSAPAQRRAEALK